MQRQKTPWNWIAICVVFAWYGQSCQTSPKHQASNQYELEDEVDLESLNNEGGNKAVVVKGPRAVRIAHPKRADAWHTRKAIMISAQPAPEKILECKESAESVALESKNLRALDESALALEGKVTQNRSTYHWCFYQLMADLDLRLERESPLLTDKSDAFLSRMRVLWVIARALDGSSKGKDRNSTTYSDYLRTRYMEISQNQFGRTVEVVDEDKLLRTAGEDGKAAGPYDGP